MVLRIPFTAATVLSMGVIVSALIYSLASTVGTTQQSRAPSQVATESGSPRSSFTFKASSSAEVAHGQITFYIVETDEQEAQAKAKESSEPESPVRSYAIYRPQTPQESTAVELSIGASLIELSEAGAWIGTYIDLRAR